MLREGDWVEKKMRFVWWAIIIILIVVAIWKLFLPHGTRAYIEKSSSTREIVVYVTGAVKEGGLISLPIDARLDDALKKVELLPEAYIEAMNLAEKLKDGQKINVPYQPVEAPEASQGSAIAAAPNLNNSNYSTTGNNAGKININTAGASELDQLPGIGPALAERIIQYRSEHGWFSNPEDLKEVSGIGNKIYEKISDQVTVGP